MLGSRPIAAQPLDGVRWSYALVVGPKRSMIVPPENRQQTSAAPPDQMTVPAKMKQGYLPE